ncbi:EAL domain-containing protein [Pontivivens insulae]|uniref:Cyclic di-GMP phosphodiesterase Gmr n=1 Tax=Pontivivens insulae TaxID=1639689 RepID=A0A2R8A9A4_9RHOB|nr:EAL domain-containing protein [Pontivivens insulae]RED12721.1 EAL domain-containing protein (putative c-di-GMP-specific phosphodiesterase class I) [Pontivivens insulae]SPF28812.1 Cyclic di-GMP phosphodiesterase Gmr [Pontivivens insulae]
MAMSDWHDDQTGLTGTPDLVADAQLVLAYQPIVVAGSGLCAFQEGLARLRNSSGELLTPDRFLPALERDGTIAQLDRLVLRRVAQRMMKAPDERFSINISGRTLGDEEWLATLRSLARCRQDVADRLIIEVTESALYDCVVAKDFLLEIRRLGPAILLDDFGAGHTAILKIRDLPLDGLKLDGGFSRRIDFDPDLQVLVRAMTTIADHFDLLTVAEFVETAGEAACLTDLGVQALQGHHFGRAEVPALIPFPNRAQTG